MDTFYQNVKKYMLDQGMIRPGESVVAGVSGGADSLCLFLVLLRMAEELPFFLEVIHVHHGLRDSALGDQKFVEELCRQRKVPCTVIKADAAAAAARWGTGVEEAGRRIRYEAFEKACKEIKARRGTPCHIAVAHHREDQAETVLFHLCRGTGLRGARGMLPVSGRIIRPMLQESRAAIENFLLQQGMTWREDETNSDTSYTRNYLRAEIFPRLEKEINPAAARRIAQFADTCAEAEKFIEKMTEEALCRCSRIECGESASNDAMAVIFLPDFLREDPYIQGRILYRCLAACAGTRRDLSSVHIQALRELCGSGEKGGRSGSSDRLEGLTEISRGWTDRSLSMPGGVTVLRRGKRLFFLNQRHIQDGAGLPEEGGFPFSEENYLCRILDFDGDMDAIPRNEYTKWFDYDRMEMFPVFRTRQPGDCMMLLSGGASQKSFTKKLARVMLDAGIPAGIRDRIVLPFIGKEALWLPGVRMGDRFRVTPRTSRVLEISFRPGDKEQ